MSQISDMGLFSGYSPGDFIRKDGTTVTTARIPFAVGISLNDGSESSPAINFAADTNTGLYRIGSDSLGIATGGARRATIYNTGISVPYDHYFISESDHGTAFSIGYYTGSAQFFFYVSSAVNHNGDDLVTGAGHAISSGYSGGDLYLYGGAGIGAGQSGGDVILQPGDGTSGATDGVVKVLDPSTFTEYTIYDGNGNGFAQQFTTTGTTKIQTFTGILRATTGVVSTASSSDLLAAIGTIDISANTNLAVSSPITLTGDTVGFDQSANFSWGGTHAFNEGFTATWNQDSFISTISSSDSGLLLQNSATSILIVGKDDSIIMSSTIYAPQLLLTGASPVIQFQDSGADDWTMGNTTNAFWKLRNATDNQDIFSVSDANALTIPVSTTFQADPIISKATPLLQFTNTSGDNYSIDVGGAAASRMRIRNTTDGTTVFDVDGSNRIAMSTNYAPQTAYKVFVQDRSTATSPAASYAALSSSFEYLPSGATSSMSQNLHGYQGGISVFATNGSITGGGGSFIGLRGDTAVFFGNGLTNSLSTAGLFGSILLSQSSGTGGTQTGATSAISTYISNGAGVTVTEVSHLRIGSVGNSGTITTLKGIHIPAMTAATNNYELFLDTTARAYFRDVNQNIYSSAASTLTYNANTTHLFNTGGTLRLTLSGTTLTFNNTGTDTTITFNNSGQLALNASEVFLNGGVRVAGGGSNLMTFDSGGAFYDYSSAWFSMSGSGSPDDGTNFYIPYVSSSGWFFGYGMGTTDAMYFGTGGSEFVIYGNGNLDIGGGSAGGRINFADASSHGSPGSYDPNTPDGYIEVRIDGGTMVSIPYWFQ